MCYCTRTQCYCIATSLGINTYSQCISLCAGIMANGSCVITFVQEHLSIRRANNYGVFRIGQRMVIAKDNIGLIRILFGLFVIIAVAGKFIVGTDDIIMLAVNDLIAEAVDVVVLRRLFRVIILDGSIGSISGSISNPFALIVLHLITFDGISDTDNLAHIGTFDVIAAAHDHDLSAAFLDGILHSLTEFRRIRNTA